MKDLQNDRCVLFDFPYSAVQAVPFRNHVEKFSQMNLKNLSNPLPKYLYPPSKTFNKKSSSISFAFSLNPFQISDLTNTIDAEYQKFFSNRIVHLEDPQEDVSLGEMNASQFSQWSKERPEVIKALIDHVSQTEAENWYHFQTTVQELKLKSKRYQRQLEDARESWNWKERGIKDDAPSPIFSEGDIHIVLFTGFESFNSDLYTQAAKTISEELQGVRVSVFTEKDIQKRPEEVETALKTATVLFASLIVEYDDALWLRERCENIPTRFVFESALELMSMTNVGSFNMASQGKSKGAPPAVKKLLSLFGSKREEDRMLGYLSFLKIGPKILKFIPGKQNLYFLCRRLCSGSRAKDLETWLTVYNYWTQSGSENFRNMIRFMIERLRGTTARNYSPPIETPTTGCLHPEHVGYFSTTRSYMDWYDAHGPIKHDAPVVAILMTRKHVITGQSYIQQMIRLFEEDGLKPLPVFITGIEAHTVVRDMITSDTEQERIAAGLQKRESLRSDAVRVDAVVNTIGFPLVGGPAGSMEAGRQADVAQAILTAKNIPYFVAAPLLIQSLESWMQDGIGGLQSVVLYALPELDGAVDTVPLGGLVGDNIFLIPERLKRLTNRVKKWTELRRKSIQERKLAILLYGFPPGVGSLGTAALLNVPKSLTALLLRLKEEVRDLRHP